MSAIKESVHVGLKWMAISMSIARASQFLSTIVLARLLSKEEFGTVMAALMVIQILRVFGQMGLGDAFIQRKDFGERDEERAINTLFILIGIANLLLFSLGLLSASYIAAWFPKVDGLDPVLKWLFTVLLLESVSSTATALLRKRLSFDRVSLGEIVFAFSYITIAISMAYLGYGVWSLVSGHIVARLLQTGYLLLASGWQPQFLFDSRIARSIMGTGAYLWGFAVLSSVGSSLDRAFTARLLGSASMGVYGISYSLCTLPANQISSVVNQISFPAMAKMQDDLSRLQSSFLKALSHVCLAAIPLGTGLFLVAENLIPFAYGVKWVDAVPVVQILAFYGMALAVASTTNPILVAMGKANHMLYTGIFSYVLLFASLWLVAGRGVEAVAWAVLLSLIAGSVVAFAIVIFHAKLGAWQVLSPICRTGLAAAFMGTAVIIVQNEFGFICTDFQMLLLTVPLGVVTFTFACLVVNRTITMDVFQTLLRVLSSRAT